MVQLAAHLFDESGDILEEIDTLIKPDGWVVDYDSEMVHGWTTEDCEFMGIPARDALDAFYSMVTKADILTAHHVQFDLSILEIEKAFLGGYRSPILPPCYCTMKHSAPVVGIPYGSGYKYPTLAESVKGVLDREVDESLLHAAGHDSKYCKDVFLGLHQLGLVP
jgi:DNA polymerase III epsilon subunit-like protein